MKKGILVVLAILLAMPAISFAGSATSRWDLTIGGQVKMTVGYADWVTGDQRAGGTAPRGDRSGFQTINNKYGTQIWAGGETGLNFAVRGPDTLGAKTSAFISGDFVGTWGNSSWGTFDLVVATMSFDWANDTVTAGMGGGFWGMMPVFAGMGWSDFGGGFKGAAPVNPGVKWAHRFNKNLTFNFAVTSPRDSNSGPNWSTSASATDQDNAANANLRSNWPLIGAGVTYSSDACGKVGPWMLTFKADGLFTQERKFFTPATNQVDDKDLNATYFDFVALVPIIPEKNGNKSGALYVDGAFYNAQNFASAGYLGGFGAAGSYVRSLGEFGVPHQAGWVGHFQYYFTDTFSFNGAYGYSKNFTSKAFKTLNPNTVLNQEWYIAQLQWQASPAVKFQLFWDHNASRYMGEFNGTPAGSLKKTGHTNQYRLSAFYYF